MIVPSRRSFLIGLLGTGVVALAPKLVVALDEAVSTADTQLPQFDRRNIFEVMLGCPDWKPGQPDVGFIVRFPSPRPNPRLLNNDFLNLGMTPRNTCRWVAPGLGPMHELIFLKHEPIRFVVEPDCPSLEARLYYDGYQAGEPRKSFLETFTWQDGNLVSQWAEPLDPPDQQIISDEDEDEYEAWQE